MKTIVFESNSKHNSLTFYKDEKEFVGECSTIFGKAPLPLELEVMVKETGNKKTFRYYGAKTDDEGDTVYWTFRADDNSGFKVVIFND